MRKTISLLILPVVAALVLNGCPKKPAKPVIVPPPQKVEVSEPGETAEEPSIRGAEFQSVPELKNVYFDYDKYTMTDDSKKTLETDAEYLKKNPELEILVEGNTCECGTNEYNLALGQKRASTVRDYLVQLGVSGSKVGTISYGEEKLVNKNAGPPDSPQCKPNRRAELKVRNTP